MQGRNVKDYLGLFVRFVENSALFNAIPALVD